MALFGLGRPEAPPLSRDGPKRRGRTATSCRSPGASCSTGSATAARWARPGCRTGRCRHAPLHGPARADAAATPRRRSIRRSSPTSRRSPGGRRATPRALGRLPEPMLRRAGEPGFRAISWDAALDQAATRARPRRAPERMAFYLTSRGITNEVVLRRAEGRALLRHESRRQLRASVPRRVDRRHEGHARLRRGHLQLRATGSAPISSSCSARTSPTTSRSPPSTCTTRRRTAPQVAVVNPYREPGLSAVLDSVDRKERDLRHRTCRPLVRREHRAAISPSSSASCRCCPSRWHRRGVRPRAHRRLRRRRCAERRRWPAWDDIETRERHAARARVEAFARLLVGSPQRGLRLVHGPDAARARRGHHQGAHERRAGARHARAGPTAGSCRSAAIPASRAARRSAACPPSRRPPRRAGPTSGGSPCRRCTGGPRPRWWRDRRHGGLDVFWIVGGNFLETLGDVEQSRRALARSRGSASTRTSSCRRRCWWTVAVTCCCCPPPRGTRHPAGARRRPPSGESSTRPKSPAGASDGKSPSGGCSGR